MKFSIGLLMITIIGLDSLKSYSVLFTLPFASVSMKNIFDPIVEALVKKGHQTLNSDKETNKLMRRVLFTFIKEWSERKIEKKIGAFGYPSVKNFKLS